MSSLQQSSERKEPGVWTVPNILTMARIVLSIVMFCLLPFGYYIASLVIFVVAVLTDKLDGWYARKYNLVSKLGRIMDPFADKLIICGTFIYLVGMAPLTVVPWGLRAWMVVVLVVREMLVTTLRSIIEGAGGDFSATWPGKIKMVFQSIAAAFCLLYMCFPPVGEGVLATTAPVWVVWVMIATLWITVVSTVYSGLLYIDAAIRALSKPKSDGDDTMDEDAISESTSPTLPR